MRIFTPPLPPLPPSEYHCESVSRVIYCVLILFRLLPTILIITSKDSKELKEAINRKLTARTPMIGFGQ